MTNYKAQMIDIQSTKRFFVAINQGYTQCLDQIPLKIEFVFERNVYLKYRFRSFYLQILSGICTFALLFQQKELCMQQSIVGRQQELAVLDKSEHCGYFVGYELFVRGVLEDAMKLPNKKNGC